MIALRCGSGGSKTRNPPVVLPGVPSCFLGIRLHVAPAAAGCFKSAGLRATPALHEIDLKLSPFPTMHLVNYGRPRVRPHVIIFKMTYKCINIIAYV